MSILLIIAWRNIWRNRRRSWVLVSALAVGTFCFVGGLAYVDGFFHQIIRGAIQLQGGHIQIASRGYDNNPTIASYFDYTKEARNSLDAMDGISHAVRVQAPGMISSAAQSSGTLIVGVEPTLEKQMSDVPQSIIDGIYLPDIATSNLIVLGQALAERLDVLVGERIVLMVNDVNNEISATAYRVAGIFRTSSRAYDIAHVFIDASQARDLVGYPNGTASLVSVQLASQRDLDASAEALRTQLPSPDLEVRTWKERSPVLVLMSDMMGMANIILVIVLFTAIGFTLINSFTMVIFERIREIGIMAAGGVRPPQIRTMLYMEGVFILMLGTAIGSALATGLIAWWSSVGLDLSRFAEGLASFGAASVVYPYVDWVHLLGGYLMIFLLVGLALLYPSIKASRFKIVDAMTHV